MTIRTLLTATAVFTLIVSHASAARAAMTVEDAVRLALQKNSRVVNSQATVLDAKSGAYSAWSGVLPRVTGSLTRFQSKTDNQVGRRLGIDRFHRLIHVAYRPVRGNVGS